MKFGSFYNGGNLIQFILAEALIAKEQQELFSLSGVQREVGGKNSTATRTASAGRAEM